MPRIVLEAFISLQLWIQAFSLLEKAGVLGVRRKDYRVIKFCPQDAKLRDDIVTRLVQIWEVERGGSGGERGGVLETLPKRHKTSSKFSTRQQQFKVKLRVNCI